MAPTALFDVDGTLLDTNYLHTLAWAEALAQYGHTPPMARIHASIGMGGDQLLDNVLGEARDRGQDGGISSAQGALYARFWPSLRAFEGAGDLLRAVSARGWTVVLASSASGRDLRVMRRALDAEDVVTAATSADDVEASKPAPDLVRAALDKAGARAAEAVFVGDTLWDIRSASAAGVPCIAVLSGGWSEHDLRAAGALEVHENAAALLAGLSDSVLGHPHAREAGD
ncbi:haloacid dehalogenase [Kitasatospora herbaricolor]|uniref:HAD family hydrolase n=1 Tax=Kitasatospora herbaricolor TaxID=68217 RepID=UPI00174C2BE9|nr:HAD family hydrolase [Kitasatospora herbaricolor]MDQ0306165.1 HAD superfamily hydrolase (TIGR01509 family) [Kitasatospora herbaricolor]GGV49427.1 haloacid dehalogenase [Kitasatospora herbaricolor]